VLHGFVSSWRLNTFRQLELCSKSGFFTRIDLVSI